MRIHVYISGGSLSLSLKMYFSGKSVGILLLMQGRMPKPSEISGYSPINFNEI